MAGALGTLVHLKAGGMGRLAKVARSFALADLVWTVAVLTDNNVDSEGLGIGLPSGSRDRGDRLDERSGW